MALQRAERGGFEASESGLLTISGAAVSKTSRRPQRKEKLPF